MLTGLVDGLAHLSAEADRGKVDLNLLYEIAGVGGQVAQLRAILGQDDGLEIVAVILPRSGKSSPSVRSSALSRPGGKAREPCDRGKFSEPRERRPRQTSRERSILVAGSRRDRCQFPLPAMSSIASRNFGSHSAFSSLILARSSSFS